MLLKPDWEQAQGRYRQWWAGEEMDRPVVHVTARRPGKESPGWSGWEFAQYPDDPEPLIERWVRCAEATYYGGEAFPSLWPNLGAGILGGCLGAHVRFQTDTVWFQTPRPWEQVGDLLLDENNLWWQRVQRIIEAAVALRNDRYIVAMTDLGGGLDVVAALRGTLNLCHDLIDQPEKVDWARARIQEAWHHCYDVLQSKIETQQQGSGAWMGLWCPGRWYPLQCDFSAMISPQMFERFVAPDLAEDCRRLDHSVYHWDGPGEIPHLNILLEIEELDAIQWTPGAGNPGVEAPQWMPLYRRIQAKGKRLVLLGAPPDAVPAMTEALGSKGVLITTWSRTPEEGEALLAEATRAARAARQN
jgi:5-methyltetrahydrofolate--homocysteine methyltransferase